MKKVLLMCSGVALALASLSMKTVGMTYYKIIGRNIQNP